MKVELKYVPGDGWLARCGLDERDVGAWPRRSEPRRRFEAHSHRPNQGRVLEWTEVDAFGRLVRHPAAETAGEESEET